MCSVSEDVSINYQLKHINLKLSLIWDKQNKPELSIKGIIRIDIFCFGPIWTQSPNVLILNGPKWSPNWTEFIRPFNNTIIVYTIYEDIYMGEGERERIAGEYFVALYSNVFWIYFPPTSYD